MVSARALLSAVSLIALTPQGRRLLQSTATAIFTPGQVLSIYVPPDKKAPDLPKRVSVTVKSECSAGVYGANLVRVFLPDARILSSHLLAASCREAPWIPIWYKQGLRGFLALCH